MQVNLVATQLVLDREHPNRMVFEDGQGLDPKIDLKFRGPNLRALIQGKASTWQSHLTLTPTGGSGGEKLPPFPLGPCSICLSYFPAVMLHLHRPCAVYTCYTITGSYKMVQAVT